MKIFSDTKIYVACPGNVHTGGPELLHQLCSLLIQYGLNAQMFYTSGNFYNPINPFYEKYHLPYVFKFEDSPHNVLVLYEAIGERYFEYKRVQKIFWWLSVNAYIGNIAGLISSISSNALANPLPKFFYFQDTEKDTEHWVQSEYARQFVILNGIHEKNVYIVEDYLSQAFLSRAANVDLNQKEDVVLFNPKKGFQITQYLIQLAPDIKWFPIQNMTPEQVQSALSKAKIYIDFGEHPGKDRIPREAAISGCVVITGKRGSAANDIDINIPAEFKFNETEEDLHKAVEKIREVFQNFKDAYDKQSDYRKRISDDKRRFENQVAEACNLKSTEKINAAALWQGYSLKSYQLLRGLAEINFGLIPKFIVDDRFGNGQNVTGDFLTHQNNHNYFDIKNSRGGGVWTAVYFDGRRKIFVLGRSHKKICPPNARRIGN